VQSEAINLRFHPAMKINKYAVAGLNDLPIAKLKGVAISFGLAADFTEVGFTLNRSV
jgi:hypothetical protein